MTEVVPEAAPVITNARQTVPPPVPQQRRFGIFSVVTPHDGGDGYWLLGGLMADGEQCSKPLVGTILCGPTPNKTSRSWYSDINADPWLTYMYETCKTVGRVGEAQARLRQRFLAVEQSSVEAGLQLNALTKATAVGTSYGSVAEAIGALEADAAREYGGQIILHVPFEVAEVAAAGPLFIRVGDHLETVGGNLVVVGNYNPTLDGGAAATPVIYASGALDLYRSDLAEIPTQVDHQAGKNDYFSLIERGYAAVVGCYLTKATATAGVLTK